MGFAVIRQAGFSWFAWLADWTKGNGLCQVAGLSGESIQRLPCSANWKRKRAPPTLRQLESLRCIHTRTPEVWSVRTTRFTTSVSSTMLRLASSTSDSSKTARRIVASGAPSIKPGRCHSLRSGHSQLTWRGRRLSHAFYLVKWRHRPTCSTRLSAFAPLTRPSFATYLDNPRRSENQ